uniref:Zinc finger PHD-type domain-containing protein n=1 Tax=Noccaea caerulescens TaxID=107243 RepID=A0A1J3D9P9_NOCCA
MMRSKSIVINSNSNSKNSSSTIAATAALRRSASNVTVATAVAHTNDLNRKPPRPRSVEFPASPQLIQGEEMVHFGHPQHVVVKVELPDIYSCAGCKEEGAGIRFVCQECDYQLHEFCALAPPLLKSHPFHYQHQLLFFAKPAKGGIMKSKCDVCGRSPKGYTFRCKACSFQMHPSCAMLSPSLSSPSLHHHPLRLLPSSSAANTTGGDYSGPAGGYICGECKRGKRVGRVYRCTVCDYHVHAVCAKDVAVNGLRANGYKGRDKSPAVLGTAARLASQVVIDFLGGIMEGLGEGVGEAILDGVTRGGGGGGGGGRGNGGATTVPRVRGG